MKSHRLACLGLTILLLTNSAGLAACDCGKCCQSSNNRGLLDTINKSFGGLMARTKKAWKKRTCDACCPSTCQSAPACGCESRPSCGCESKPSCGCETRPTCGCETKPSCGCEQEPTCGCELRPGCDADCHAVTPTGKPAAIVTPRQQIWPGVPPKPPVQQLMVPEQRVPSLQTQPLVPVPRSDREVDPFMDEAVNRIRKAPAKTIQYRRSKPSYGNQYDPQAVRLRSRVNDANPAAGQGDATVANRQFASSTSSRVQLSPSAPDAIAITRLTTERVLAEKVIPASASIPARVISASKHLSDYATEEEIINPLRR